MHKNKFTKSKYFFLYTLSLFIVLISITMTIMIFVYFQRTTREIIDTSEYDQYYVIIPEDRKLGFWESVYEGAYEQGLKNNIYVEMLGENLSEDYTNEELMEIAIASRVDGIIVAANDSNEMTNLINQAADAGIPVVTVYNDNTKSERCCFVGVGSYNLGREYGRQVLKIDKVRKKLRINSGPNTATVSEEASLNVVVLVNAYTEDSGQNIVCSGIQETIDKEKVSGSEINMTLVSVDDKNTFSVEESIRDIFMEEDLPDVIVCLNELNTTCVYQALVDYNKVGVVDVLGYYDSPTIINAISREVMYATLTVDTLQMGRYCVNALEEYHELGNTSQYLTADITLIDKNNVEQFMSGGDIVEEEN